MSFRLFKLGAPDGAAGYSHDCDRAVFDFVGAEQPVGWIKDATGGTDVALHILSAVLFLGTMLVLRVPARTVNR
jgi:hypothetical protein